MSYRDIPQTTYSRLMASEAGKKPPAPSQPRSGKGKATKDAAGHLEPLEACEALLYSLPAGLRETLLPFQRDGVLYGLRRRGRCLIADEMGTGKVRLVCAAVSNLRASVFRRCPFSLATFETHGASRDGHREGAVVASRFGVPPPPFFSFCCV